LRLSEVLLTRLIKLNANREERREGLRKVRRKEERSTS
jgi:hypothetical protein